VRPAPDIKEIVLAALTEAGYRVRSGDPGRAFGAGLRS
jgi:hypothetical protein